MTNELFWTRVMGLIKLNTFGGEEKGVQNFIFFPKEGNWHQ